MIYLFSVFILACGYYTLTYGINLWKMGDEKLAGFGAIAIALAGTVAPIIVMFLKR